MPVYVRLPRGQRRRIQKRLRKTNNRIEAVRCRVLLLLHEGWAANIIATVVSQQFRKIDCDSSAPQDALETVDTSGMSGLHCDDSNQYIFTWQTSSTFANKCYEFILTLSNGMQNTARFKFTK